MRRSLPWLLTILLLSGCARLDAIPYTPPQTAATWLTIQPYAAIKIGALEIILVQPSTTFFVYLLGVVAIGAGLYFFRIRQGQKSRLWWGIALVLWGAGALLAGTSYEAFSYALKCAGRPACVWTSWWEVLYLILSVASVDAMLVAEAYACATGRLRRWLIIYAAANLAVYVVDRADRRAGSRQVPDLVRAVDPLRGADDPALLHPQRLALREIQGSHGSGAAGRVGLAGADPCRVFRLPDVGAHADLVGDAASGSPRMTCCTSG